MHGCRKEVERKEKGSRKEGERKEKRRRKEGKRKENRRQQSFLFISPSPLSLSAGGWVGMPIC
jgi:hypothetical protein